SLHSGARRKHDKLFDHSRKDRDCWVFLTGLVVVDDRSDVESELEGDLGDGREAGDSSVRPWRGDQADAVGGQAVVRFVRLPEEPRRERAVPLDVEWPLQEDNGSRAQRGEKLLEDQPPVDAARLVRDCSEVMLSSLAVADREPDQLARVECSHYFGTARCEDCLPCRYVDE